MTHLLIRGYSLFRDWPTEGDLYIIINQHLIQNLDKGRDKGDVTPGQWALIAAFKTEKVETINDFEIYLAYSAYSLSSDGSKIDTDALVAFVNQRLPKIPNRIHERIEQLGFTFGQVGNFSIICDIDTAYDVYTL